MEEEYKGSLSLKESSELGTGVRIGAEIFASVLNPIIKKKYS